MIGYDGVFLMNYILKNICPKDPQPVVISTGTKLLSIRFRNVRIIDSFSFIPIGLAQFPTAFGIKELKKGFFPHIFNTNENQSYIGPYPDASTYSPHLFSIKKRKEFEAWYESVRNQTFDFKKEFEEYCWSDVYLLASGCCKFRQIILDLTKPHAIDPFENSITIASMCHLIYRSMILQPQTLPYIHEKGYNPEKNYSFKALSWLKFISIKLNLNLQYAGNGGEKQIGPYFLDGFDATNHTGYEFHGCFYHGCLKCYTSSTFNTVRQLTMRIINEIHCKRIEYLKKYIKIVEIWECEYDKIDDPLLENVKKSIQEPLNPRHALFGGRTNALRLHYRVQNDEKINYVDFTSLYPYVQKYCEFPVGHPTIIHENFNDISNYFGIIKCKIIPPRGLYIPVLPAKIRNKLVFTLCRTCAENESRQCTHNDNDRALVGTWVSLEIKKALELGYVVADIFEVWHWDRTEKYDESSQSGGLFTKYINMFLKRKQEASGYPSDVNTNEEKNQYISDYFKNEGIELESEAIEFNPAKRFLFKI